MNDQHMVGDGLLKYLIDFALSCNPLQSFAVMSHSLKGGS